MAKLNELTGAINALKETLESVPLPDDVNPNAPTLPGIEEDDGTKVTIKTGGETIFTTAKKLRQASKRTTEGGAA